MRLFSNLDAYWELWAKDPDAVRLSSALLHFLWQGAALAAIAFLLSVVLKRARPHIRYAALVVILGAMAACPAITFLAVDGEIAGINAEEFQSARPVSIPDTSHEDPLSATMRNRGEESRNTKSRESLNVDEARSPTKISSVKGVPSAALLAEAARWWEHHRPWIVAIWLLGVFVLVLRLASGLIGAEQARRRGLNPAAESLQQLVVRLSGRLGIRRTVRVFESALAEVPTLIGWLSPVVLLPASALSGLSQLQLEAILAHELAHVRRHDYLVNLMQTLVETFLFYHPAVWWVSRSIRQEREHCCDDVAIDVCGDRLVYARALASLEALRASPPQWVVAAASGSLAARIRRVVGRPEQAKNDKLSLVAAAAAMLLVLSLAVHFRSSAAAAGAIAPEQGTVASEASAAAGAPTSSPTQAKAEAHQNEHATPTISKQGSKSTPAPREYSIHVVNTRGKPVVGATVHVWAVGWREGRRSGSFRVDDKLFPPTKTDAEGVVRIVFPSKGDDRTIGKLRAAEKKGFSEVALVIDHPDHPVWDQYVSLEGKRRIVLSDSTTVVVRAHRENETGLLRHLYPVLRGSPFASGADWSERDGVLTMRRVDTTDSRLVHLLRIVQVPEKGPALFSEVIDLKRHIENPLSLNFTMKTGVRVEGRLADEVPRPVKNGRVVAEISTGYNDFGDAWSWYATALIAADGTFVLDSLPWDENLQVIALCDDWVSTSPTQAEVTAYSAEHTFGVFYQGPISGVVSPRLYRLKGTVIKPVIPMQRTASCKVTVVDNTGQPIPGASVAFSPNQKWLNSGAGFVGAGFDGLGIIRAQLASGIHQSVPDMARFRVAYEAKTDARGVAVVQNLPAEEPADGTLPQWSTIWVTCQGYAPTFKPLDRPTTGVKLVPGQTARTTVRLTRK